MFRVHRNCWKQRGAAPTPQDLAGCSESFKASGANPRSDLSKHSELFKAVGCKPTQCRISSKSEEDFRALQYQWCFRLVGGVVLDGAKILVLCLTVSLLCDHVMD